MHYKAAGSRRCRCAKLRINIYQSFDFGYSRSAHEIGMMRREDIMDPDGFGEYCDHVFIDTLSILYG